MRSSQAIGLSCSFLLGAAAVFAVTINVFGDLSHPTRITVELLALIGLQALRHLRFWVSRELLLNFAFLGYALLTLAWTDDINAAVATLPAMFNFILELLFFSSLIAYHDLRATLGGMFAGFLAAAAFYTLTEGFPFTYPEDFSYNTIAGMYLSGLFITMVNGAYRGWRLVPLALGAVFLTLIAATTSIKTNLGVWMGIFVSGMLYFRLSFRSAIRTLIVLALLGTGMAYYVASNPALTERVQSGFARVSSGIAVLTNRENDTGSTGLGTRQGWQKEGLKGWAATPVFGHGVEAFRSDFGITSHSTPIDLLYNAGMIGCGLFYAMLASIAWRLMQSRNRAWRSVRARISVCLIAYSFMSLSGILYYDPFVAIFISVSSGLLLRLEHAGQQSVRWVGAGREPDGPALRT